MLRLQNPLCKHLSTTQYYRASVQLSEMNIELQDKAKIEYEKVRRKVDNNHNMTIGEKAALLK